MICQVMQPTETSSISSARGVLLGKAKETHGDWVKCYILQFQNEDVDERRFH